MDLAPARDRGPGGGPKKATFDVAVIGGGPAGTAAAATAARHGLDVVLYDASFLRPPNPTTDSSRQSFAPGEGAPPGTERLLCDIFGPEASPFAAEDHVPSYGSTSVWGDDRQHASDHVFHPDGHGWHLDRGRFDERLRAAAVVLGVQRRESVVQPPVASTNELWDVDDACRAMVIVDASGRQASFARSLGAHRSKRDRLVALVGVFSRSGSDENLATVVEATSSGWWYTAPIPSERRMVAFFTDADLLSRNLRHETEFRAAFGLVPSIASIVRGDAGLVRPPRLIAADTATLDPVGGKSWVATGDAVASFDPLASQGIITALDLGRHAGEVAVSMATPRGNDPARVGAALDDYRGRRDAVMAEHLRARADHHLDELRWPDAPFWSRRHRAPVR